LLNDVEPDGKGSKGKLSVRENQRTTRSIHPGDTPSGEKKERGLWWGPKNKESVKKGRKVSFVRGVEAPGH